LELVAIVVAEYDPAIGFFVRQLVGSAGSCVAMRRGHR
jgi:hypothetical protein